MNEKLKKAAELLLDLTKANNSVAANRLNLSIVADDLVTAVGRLRDARWGYLSAITGLDLDQGNGAGKIEVLYQFCAGDDVLTLRILLERAAPTIHSLCPINPSANVLEWELSEMFGITIADSKNPKHLYLPDEWPDGVYPMRKDAAVELATT